MFMAMTLFGFTFSGTLAVEIAAVALVAVGAAIWAMRRGR